MAQGAIFSLVLRDERFDRFFTASDYLRRRLDSVRLQRAKAREPNVQPTFVDIERSHLLWVRGSYRPYVAVASEYARVRAAGDSGAAVAAGGNVCEFTLPTFGHFVSDMALHVRFRAIGDPGAAAPSAETPYLRYCAFPGVRLFRHIALRSGETLIDDYGPDEAMAAAKFFVGADQRAGWERCVGQQTVNAATYLANGCTGVFQYSDGPQTPKLAHPALDLFVPLQFWYCRGPEDALLNDLIPNSQRTLTCTLAPLADIVQALLPDPLNPGGLAPVPLPFARLTADVELYVNGLFVNPEIHDVFASRISFSLVRVHRRQTNQLQSAADRFLLDQLKFPAEFLLAGIRSRALAADFDRWWLMGAPVARTDATALAVPAIIWNAGLGIFQLVVRRATEVSTLDPLVETIGLKAHGNDLFAPTPFPFFASYAPIRYGGIAGGGVLVAPGDAGAFLVNFCLFPGRFSPSGYYNLSAGRELYLSYTLKPAYADIAPGEAELVISMSSLNFLVRRGDMVVLKFSL